MSSMLLYGFIFHGTISLHWFICLSYCFPKTTLSQQFSFQLLIELMEIRWNMGIFCGGLALVFNGNHSKASTAWLLVHQSIGWVWWWWFQLNKYMWWYWFDAILSCLQFCSNPPPDYEDKSWQVREMMEAWNENMKKPLGLDGSAALISLWWLAQWILLWLYVCSL